MGKEPGAELRRPHGARPGSAIRRTGSRRSSTRGTRRRAGPRRFDEMLADAELDAVVIATPVPTHYELAKQALEAGKHVFVEKPPAMTGAEIEELVAIARERDLVLMPGHLLLYHPGVQKLKELVDEGALGDVLMRLRKSAEPRRYPQARERAVVARRPRPVGDPLPPRRGSDEAVALGRTCCSPASRTSSSATCAFRRGASRTCTSRGSIRTRCGR